MVFSENSHAKDLESHFEWHLTLEKLKELGAEQIGNMTYYKLRKDGLEGIYEPDYNSKQNGVCQKYFLRRVLDDPTSHDGF